KRTRNRGIRIPRRAGRDVHATERSVRAVPRSRRPVALVSRDGDADWNHAGTRVRLTAANADGARNDTPAARIQKEFGPLAARANPNGPAGKARRNRPAGFRHSARTQ